MDTRIADTTLEDISSDGSGTEADLEQFKAACVNYQEHHRCSDQEALDAVFGEGDCWTTVLAWTDELEAAEAAADSAYDAWKNGY